MECAIQSMPVVTRLRVACCTPSPEGGGSDCRRQSGGGVAAALASQPHARLLQGRHPTRPAGAGRPPPYRGGDSHHLCSRAWPDANERVASKNLIHLHQVSFVKPGYCPLQPI